ncbi:hypothetical protein DSM106972_093450 [Dulcicalothrix desertica PCC 7102]|uniref:Uncharacterized protein n=1 Tax=Dulcicalothrix desertica PCC 7102 TaxID=232991 RepID=A0A433UKS7_9CYAN|nr:hypothetical protein [Dulcicalothrix desertica]RUS94450.1 hypothetical protein DSM106972_093450 [Dulcicalothrix desertica PCC 7102]TWH61395.1 hypothetical protein CAL7102_00955 [Dulcicalothrix desertica PCC 7102]
MATKNPKLTCYPNPRLYNKFIQWKKDQGYLADSKALNVILEAFFHDVSSDNTALSLQLRLLEQKVSNLSEQVAALTQNSDNRLTADHYLPLASSDEAFDQQRFSIELFKTWQRITLEQIGELNHFGYLVTIDAIARSGFSEMGLEKFIKYLAGVRIPEIKLKAGQQNNYKVGNHNAWTLTFDREPAQTSSEKTESQQLMTTTPLKQSALAKRLQVGESTLNKKRDKVDFTQWSKSKDPDGVGWKFDKELSIFLPVNVDD